MINFRLCRNVHNGFYYARFVYIALGFVDFIYVFYKIYTEVWHRRKVCRFV
jgi:hypothetical protein